MRALLAPAAIAVLLLTTSSAGAAGAPGQGGGVDFRAGVFFPSADSDFWDEKEDNFTLDHSDMDGFTASLGYVAPINNYVEFDIDAAFYAAEELSSDADFTDTFGNDIFHDTRLFTFPVTVSVRVLPAGRYARRGAEGRHYVRRPAPYIGAGVGLTYWRFEEEGDFVFDSPTGFVVDYDRMQDDGVEFETHVKAGIEFPISPVWSLTLEARQSWVEATLDQGFPSQALSPSPVPRELDLGGLSVLFGASMRF